MLVAIELAGCAPLAGFRPASGMIAGNATEIGAGAAAVSPRPYVDETWQGAGQLWLTHEAARPVTLSAIAAFDDEAAAFGGAVRLDLPRSDRFAAGVEAELGLAWAALSLPVALRLVEQCYLYSGPRLGTWSADALPSVPLGVSVPLYDGLIVRAEAQLSWQGFRYYNRRSTLGLAVAHQF